MFFNFSTNTPYSNTTAIPSTGSGSSSSSNNNNNSNESSFRMNGMTNLPQFYQDIMRSPFAAAAAAAHFANNNPNNPNQQMNKMPPLPNPHQLLQQHQQHNNQMAAAAAMAAQVQAVAAAASAQKQHQNNFNTQNFVAQMQQISQLNAVQQQQFNVNFFRQQQQHHQQQQQQHQQQQLLLSPNKTSSIGFQYPKFYNKNDKKQNNYYENNNEGYSVNHNGNNHLEMITEEPKGLNDPKSQQSRQKKKQDLAAFPVNYANNNFNKQQQQIQSAFNQQRGRGRPPRPKQEMINENEKMINGSTNVLNKSLSPAHTANSRTNSSTSPNHSRSRSRSPRLSKSPATSNQIKSEENRDNQQSVTRTSTPSKLSAYHANTSMTANSNNNNNHHHHTNETEDNVEDANTDVYSSICDAEENYDEHVDDAEKVNDEEEDIDIDAADEDEIIDEEDVDEDATTTNLHETDDFEEDEMEDDLNTSNSTRSTRTTSEMEKNIRKKPSVPTKSNSNRNSNEAMSSSSGQINRPVYDFTLQALEMSLYGYLRQNDHLFAGHAISGLRVPHFLFNNHSNLQQIQQQLTNTANSNNENLSSSSSSISSESSSSSSLSNKNESLQQITKQTNKKSNFSIENLLTSPPPSASTSSQSSSSLTVPNSNLMNFNPNAIPYLPPPPPPGLIDIDKMDLPDELQIRPTYLPDFAHYGVFCKKTVIAKSTKFGPYPGKTINPTELKSTDDNHHMWEIFNDGRLSHYIDGSRLSCSSSSISSSSSSSSSSSKVSPNLLNSTSSSSSSMSSSNTVNNQWMIYVNCARFAQEQNLIAVQSDGEIYYEVCKDIAQGQELLVWYGDSYLQFLGIPVSLKDMTDEVSEETTENKDGYSCDRCGKVFAYKYYRDKHLKYTRCVDQGDRKFPCHLCTRSFEKRDRLRIHILHVHEKHRPHKCSVCGKSFSQSSSLNKHMRVHSGERPYKCVYCNKAFTASSILRTHIRQHSGEKPFKCKYCGKAFASHAAHDSHVRRTHCMTKEKEANLIL